jgi:hypothetical protein
VKGAFSLTLRPSRASTSEAGTCDATQRAVEIRQRERIDGLRSSAGPALLLNNQSEIRKDERLIRQSLLLLICDPRSVNCAWLPSLTPKQWRSILRWLDLSGLALYFFDRIAKSQWADHLPDEVLSALERRLIENTQRTRSMIDESIAIQRDFQKRGLCYAVVKGLSLWPNSVPRPELRLQFDLDYLLADEDMQEAQNILIRRGYRPRASSERCWKFIRNEPRCLTLKDVYKDTGSWVVELHEVRAGSARTSPLLNLQRRELFGLSMPTLSPVEVFLRQGLHAYKDVCSQFFRISLLVDFYRHVLFYKEDATFWTALHWEAKKNPQAALGLGVVTLLITQVIGDFAPEALTHWTVDRLPPTARLWVTTYGRRSVLGSFPGSKLYRLLARELEADEISTEVSLPQSTSPSRLTAPVRPDFLKESLFERLTRFVRLIPYRIQLDLIPSRLRFYCVEGLRLAWETRRWHRLLGEGLQ